MPRARLLELLPDEQREPRSESGAAGWIAAEARRMKEANEILPNITKTDFAKELERRMSKAAKPTNPSARSGGAAS